MGWAVAIVLGDELGFVVLVLGWVLDLERAKRVWCFWFGGLMVRGWGINRVTREERCCL